MLALHTTSLTLVITDGVGDQPIRATGLVMVHLETIVGQMSKKPRIWMLRPTAISAKRSWDYLNRIAKYTHVAWTHLWRRSGSGLDLLRGAVRNRAGGRSRVVTHASTPLSN